MAHRQRKRINRNGPSLFSSVENGKSRSSKARGGTKRATRRNRRTVLENLLSIFGEEERQKRKRRRSRSRKKKKGIFRRVFSPLFRGSTFISLMSVGMTFLIFLLGTLLFFAHDMPNISGLGAAKTSPSIQIVDSSGEVIAQYGDMYGEYLEFSEIPSTLIGALIATEDRNFFNHFGIDPKGIARAMLINLKRGRFVQGGSTITQQLAKNIFLTPDRTLKRKIQEMLLAFWLESKFTKQEILSIYLNRVYLGAGNYGIDAAARFYFNKSARDLSLAESSLIVGLLKAPSRYSPTNSEEKARGRAHQVLLNMVNAGRLEAAEVEPAMASLQFHKSEHRRVDAKARYFTDWIVETLPEYIGDISDDIIIKTTLSTELQQKAENIVKQHITAEVMEQRKITQAALVVMRPDGAIVTMVGGLDYGKSQYNRVTHAKRQPGSAFKMIVYLTAIEMGYTPESVIEDKPVDIDGWKPQNYNHKYMGMVTLREAFAKSINTVAVELGRLAGLERVVNMAKRLGIRSEIIATPSLSLGASEVTPLEMTTAYAHLASNGKMVVPYGITEIRRKFDDKVIYEHRSFDDVIVIGREYVAEMNSMLSSVITEGTGRAAYFGRPVAGKTGTTSMYRDAWFIGYSPEYVAGVWVGNDDASEMNHVSGGGIPARIWRSVMIEAHKGVAISDLPTDYGASDDEEELPWKKETLPWQEKKPLLGREFWRKLFGGQ